MSTFCTASPTQFNPNIASIDQIIGDIKSLEGKSDPKCYATASRLEDFMYGTALSDKARSYKNTLQKQLVTHIWQLASNYAEKAGQSDISIHHIQQAIPKELEITESNNGNWLISRKGKITSGTKNPLTLEILKHDKRHYSSIAYSLRAALALQQELLLTDQHFLPLSDNALDELTQIVDLLILAILQMADNEARLSHAYEVSPEHLQTARNKLLLHHITPGITSEPSKQYSTPIPKQQSFATLKKIIQQKVASYEAYNQISNQLFVRNLQVYFARARWPKEQNEGKKFKSTFQNAMLGFAEDIYLGAEKIARRKQHPFIKEEDVSEFSQLFIPHHINDYEDAIFFPKFNFSDQIIIESYDMDAFRDSGIHWRYLQFIIEGNNFKGNLEPDPFAAELIVENIAQFGVLLLRVAGLQSKQSQRQRLHPDDIHLALQLIQEKINKHANVAKSTSAENHNIISSNISKPKTHSNTGFTNITSTTHIQFMHRSSDWLNRLLRSYLKKDQHTGIITIPPAFGGAGVAAEDINNDGHIDILLLSGLGNKLYLNKGNGQFTDITKKAGLNWTRKQDNLPGEPRQPIIADFNNDGLQDILITYVNDNHRLYQNTGNNQFLDVTDKAKLGGKDLVAGPATVLDYDNDGLLDIYIGYFGDYIHGVLPTLARRNTNGLSNKLFKNTGNFQFKDISNSSDASGSGWTQAVGHTDFDGDGWQDLIVGNDFGINEYYRNLGNGKFIEVAQQLGTNKPSYTMNIGIADLNKDNLPDIYISNIVTMNKDEKYVLPNKDTTVKFNPDKLANMRVVEANDLFISQKNSDNNLPRYQLSYDVERGYSSTGWSWDADFFDYDNDGDDDLYVLNGMNEFNLYSNENPYYTDPHENKKLNIYMPVSPKETNVFFENQNGKLQNISKQSGTDLLSNSRSAAYLDYDNDGDLDIILNNYHEKATFYLNNAERQSNNWVKIKLIGNPKSKINRDAIGAKIIIETENGNKIWREIHSTTGYLSVHPKQQHFGLGKQNIHKLTIIWPNNRKQVVTDKIKVNSLNTISYSDNKYAVN